MHVVTLKGPITKKNRNKNKRINIVTMFISRIIEIIKLINNQLNKNEPTG